MFLNASNVAISHDLTGSLQSLTITSQNLNIQIPPEIVEYLEEGRNPDIYTREFVELVQKGNQYLKGKSEAFGSFRDILAEDIIKAWPEMEKNVRGIVRGQSRNADVKMENGDGNRGLEGKVRSNGIAEEKK